MLTDAIELCNRTRQTTGVEKITADLDSLGRWLTLAYSDNFGPPKPTNAFLTDCLKTFSKKFFEDQLRY